MPLVLNSYPKWRLQVVRLTALVWDLEYFREYDQYQMLLFTASNMLFLDSKIALRTPIYAQEPTRSQHR